MVSEDCKRNPPFMGTTRKPPVSAIVEAFFKARRTAGFRCLLWMMASMDAK